MADQQSSSPGRLTIREWASDDRPRERLLSQGAGALSDAELLAILIRSGTVQASALDLARQVLVMAGNDLGKLGRLSVAQLVQVKGLGQAKAIGIAAALELGRRRRDASPEQRVRITTSAVAFELLHPLMADLMHEEFWLILLDRGNAVTGKVRVSQGGMHGTVADPKVIFREAIDRRAAGVVLAHNHPSGRAIPSEEDVRLTRKLVDGGRLLDIAVHDHLIITSTGYYSFADNGSL
ncbi:MAG: DNA repair protein RadC [Flavobacteriales bacterium]|jgi:DNA repair protein RadC|nr:DNA repair protein RadC [Flavobacteriales bacterium]MBK7940302.1 DNA repair protein RadC [Flavobacteriales bacterium]MBK8950022.1 DNA repair protein RadC [Flavobacteriales bacterium]MBK9699538.1 DNA repair protein RadC [Flavobacteriales bacterium]